MLAMKGRDYDATHRWKRVSMVFQAAMNSLDPVYTIGEQLAEVLEEHKRARGADDAIASAIRDVGLEGSVLRQYPHELSGGMRQRAVIAMALLLEPRLVIADEPTTALDVLVQSQVIGVLRRLRQRGTSVIVITHDLALLSEIADVVAIMYAGQIVELGCAREIYDSPRHPYTQALIAATPTIHGDAPQHISGRARRTWPVRARRAGLCRAVRTRWKSAMWIRTCLAILQDTRDAGSTSSAARREGTSRRSGEPRFARPFCRSISRRDGALSQTRLSGPLCAPPR